MTNTFRFGRIAGIEVGAHWTWLLVVALLVWSLSAGVFPRANPGLADATYLAMACAAALLFFGSILAHELGHAVQARRVGVPIDGITLWVFGGVARMGAQMPSPGAEFRIAVAGPLVTVVIAAVCVGLAVAVPLPPEVDGVVHWLGWINVTLLVFNLIPAFPLDGGRILRAALWRATGDLLTATRWASTAGKAFAVAMIAGGFVSALLGEPFGGLWLAFVGFFLLEAADAELMRARTATVLEPVPDDEDPFRRPEPVPAQASLERFLGGLADGRSRADYRVVRNEIPIGMLSFHANPVAPPPRRRRTGSVM